MLVIRPAFQHFERKGTMRKYAKTMENVSIVQMCFIQWVKFSESEPNLARSHWIQIRTDFLRGRTCPLIPFGCFQSPNTNKWRCTKPSTAQDWSNNSIAKEQTPMSVLKLFRTNMTLVLNFSGSISFGYAFLKLASVDANSGRSNKLSLI